MTMTNTYDDYCLSWGGSQQQAIMSYTEGRTHFIPDLLPAVAVQMPTMQVLYILEKRLGQATLYQALNPNNTIDSPVQHHADGTWLKQVNMVGINVRTIQSFWNVVKYTLTLPASQSSIHLLPIWECGVVASLYGMASWNVNPEFFDAELAGHLSHLDTVEKQLKVVVNLIHAMGKSIGMDVIPHTDRYAEVALANPSYYEWLQRREFSITNHDAHLHEAVQQRIMAFLQEVGPAVAMEYPSDVPTFFSNTAFPEEKRLKVLFGEKQDLWARNKRRNELINYLFAEGYETVPATMAPPYRGLAVDTREEAKTVDEDGRVWRDFVITKPQKMSRVFGPLSRYKLYEAKNNNQDWEIDFDKPRPEVWKYVADKFLFFAQSYSFDFMRGDMSHVQMQPNGTPANPDKYYDIHKYIKRYVRQYKPWFGYFAESFLAPPNEMAFGEEEAHLEGSDTDTTLGDLQSMVVGTNEFIGHFARYHQLIYTRSFSPNFTIMTADKDDPRFDAFYLKGNEVRFFMAMFLTDMPSYMGLGFEQRDPHPTPAPNEHYTKLYVFQLSEGEKATKTPYIWGRNITLFRNLTAIKQQADAILPHILDNPIQWIIAPDATAEQKVIAWTQANNPQYVFVVNLDLENTAKSISLAKLEKYEVLHNIFKDEASESLDLFRQNDIFVLEEIAPAACLIFQV